MNTSQIFVRALLVWLVIIAAESIHGTLRILLLEPELGPVRSRQYSVFTGSLLIFAITYISVRWIGASSRLQLLLVGVGWVLLTVVFELLLGRLAMGLTWDQIIRDYDLSRGGLMLFGLIFMAIVPILADRLRSIKRAAR